MYPHTTLLVIRQGIRSGDTAKVLIFINREIFIVKKMKKQAKIIHLLIFSEQMDYKINIILFPNHFLQIFIINITIAIRNALNSHQSISDDGINDGIKTDLILTDYEQKILTIIANSPKATAKDMAGILEVKPRQCERILSEMKKKNLIERVGANKNDMWIALV